MSKFCAKVKMRYLCPDFISSFEYMKKALASLAFGTFGLGITEFFIMAILPFIAADFGVSIPRAGNMISAYALGVCVGAPLMLFVLRNMPLKRILVLLLGIFIAASLGMTFAPDYRTMMLMRFLAGLPHGAYFGVASIVADRLSKHGKAATAVAIMCSGMSFANLVGIPLGTAICQMFSWRAIYAFSTLWGCVTLGAILAFVPRMDALENRGAKGQFYFLKSPAPWLVIGATLFGNGGVFCFYSYVSPFLTNYVGVAERFLPLMMVVAGVGMVAGNLTGGIISDRIGPGRTGRMLQFAMIACLTGLLLLGKYEFVGIPLVFIVVFCLFGVGSPQQLLLLRYSQGGELLGGAMVQIAFNLGNAVGAWLGGVPLTCGLDYNTVAVPGIAMVVCGIACYTVFCRKYENGRA